MQLLEQKDEGHKNWNLRESVSKRGGESARKRGKELRISCKSYLWYECYSPADHSGSDRFSRKISIRWTIYTIFIKHKLVLPIITTLIN